MPAQKQSETEVTQTPQEAAGVEGAQAKPTEDMSAKELKAVMTHEPDKELHSASDPKHPADQTSAPVALPTDPERPPVSTARPDVPVLRSLVTGAGAHRPPDPDKFDAEGRPKD